MVTGPDTFEHRGEEWTRKPVRPIDRFVVAMDVGQSNDPSALAVIHHRCEGLDTWSERRGTNNLLIQNSQVAFEVRHLERLPLGMPYPDQIAYVQSVLSRPPLRLGCDFLLDDTGCGRPVGDAFEAAGLRPERVSITAGDAETKREGRRWHVSKSILVSTLDARLHSGELRIAKALIEAGPLAEEMQNFRRHVSAAGRASYSARAGAHDDLVLAVAIGLWWAARPISPAGQAYYCEGLW